MDNKGKEMRYPWANPYEWLAQKMKSYSREKLEERYLEAATESHVHFLRGDVYKEMEEDGYYKLVPVTKEEEE